MKKICAALALTLALAACAEQMPAPASVVDKSLPPKINLDVQAINLADRSGLQPASSPYNGNHFSPTIIEAIKQWAGDRLQASGQSGQAIIIVKDASLISQNLPIEQGVDGWFTRQQGSKYIGRTDVTIEANGPQGFAVTDAVATRAVTLAENPTAVEKQSAYFSLLNGLMKDLGQNLEAGIYDHMGGFIITAPILGMTTPLPPMSANEIVSPVLIEAPNPPSVPITAQPAILQVPVTAEQVTPPVMTISQSAQAIPAIQLHPREPVSQPQAPMFGASAAPVIPNTASLPSSFGMAVDAPQPMQQQAALQPISVTSEAPAQIQPVMQLAPQVQAEPMNLASVQAQTLERTVTIPLSRGPYGQ